MSYMIYFYDFSFILKPQKSNQQIKCDGKDLHGFIFVLLH